MRLPAPERAAQAGSHQGGNARPSYAGRPCLPHPARRQRARSWGRRRHLWSTCDWREYSDWHVWRRMCAGGWVSLPVRGGNLGEVSAVACYGANCAMEERLATGTRSDPRSSEEIRPWESALRNPNRFCCSACLICRLDITLERSWPIGQSMSLITNKYLRGRQGFRGKSTKR